MGSKYRPAPVLALLVAAVIVGGSPKSAAEGDGSPPISLPAFRVEGKFSELLCGARFRYHVPGAGLKDLVLRKVPKSWSAAGVKVGDSIIQIDEEKIEGLSIFDLVKFLQARFKSDPAICVFEVRSGQGQKVTRIEAHFQKDSDVFTIAYP